MNFHDTSGVQQRFKLIYENAHEATFEGKKSASDDNETFYIFTPY